MNNDNGYNGWRNYETWNVALYIQNDYKLYQIAKGCRNYKQFLRMSISDRGFSTPDGISWHHPNIYRSEINAMFRELNE